MNNKNGTCTAISIKISRQARCNDVTNVYEIMNSSRYGKAVKNEYHRKTDKRGNPLQNPRINDNAVPAVMKSIEEFGFKVPIVIDKNGTIVTGHTRLKAAKKLGMKTVPCIVADDLTPEQIKAFRLADNKVAEAAEWDMELLNEELDGIIDIDMSDFNFGDITDSPSSEDVVEDDGENIELPSEPKTRLGDIWMIGRHKLMCGDATSEDVLKRLMGGEQSGYVPHRSSV